MRRSSLEIVVIDRQRFGTTLWLVAHLLFLSSSPGVELGLLQVSFALCDRKEPIFTDTFKQLAIGPRFLARQIIYLLMFTLGLLRSVVPGAYFTAGAYCESSHSSSQLSSPAQF